MPAVRSALTALVALCAQIACAAESTQARTEEIVITDVFAAPDAEPATASTLAFDREALARSTDRDDRDLLRRLPNVFVDPETNTLTIRGLRNLGFAGSGPNSGMTVDGTLFTPFFSAASQISLWDMERVDVTRGSSTMGAMAAASGSIDLTTVRPSFERDAALLLETSNQHDRRAGVAYGDVLIPGELAFRISGATDYRRGVVENVFLGDDEWNERESYLWRLKLLWRPAVLDGTEVRFTYQGTKNQFGSLFNRLTRVLRVDGFDPYRRETALNTPEWEKQRFDLFHLEIDHRFTPELTMSHSLSMQKRSTSGQRDVDGFVDRDFVVLTRFVATDYFVDSRINYDGDWQLMGGWFFSRQNPLDFRGLQTFDIDLDGSRGSLPPARTAINYGFVDILQGHALLASASRTWFDRLTTTAGVRYTRGYLTSRRPTSYRRQASTGSAQVDAIYDGAFARFLGDLTPEQHLKATFPLYSGAVTFAVTDDVVIGANYAEGFRIGGTDINFSQRTAVPYADERSFNRELFARASLLDGRLQLRATLFRMRFEDLQIRKCFSNDGNDCNVVNAGIATNQGVEAELEYQPTENLQLWLNAGTYQFRYRDVRAEIVEKPTDRARNAQTPWNLAAGVNYQNANGYFAAIDANYQDTAAVELTDDLGVETTGVFTLNLRAGWESSRGDSPGYGVSLFARNLLNERHIAWINPALPSRRDQSGAVGEPRTWGVTLTGRL